MVGLLERCTSAPVIPVSHTVLVNTGLCEQPVLYRPHWQYCADEEGTGPEALRK